MSLATERAALKTRASAVTSGGYTLTAARIKLGYRPKDATADTPTPSDFLETLVSSGPYMVLGKGSRKVSGLSRPYAIPEVFDYTLEAKLWIGIDRETNDTLEVIETFVEAVVAAMENSTHSVSIDFEEPDINTDRDPVVVLYKLKISITVG